MGMLYKFFKSHRLKIFFIVFVFSSLTISVSTFAVSFTDFSLNKNINLCDKSFINCKFQTSVQDLTSNINNIKIPEIKHSQNLKAEVHTQVKKTDVNAIKKFGKSLSSVSDDIAYGWVFFINGFVLDTKNNIKEIKEISNIVSSKAVNINKKETNQVNQNLNNKNISSPALVTITKEVQIPSRIINTIKGDIGLRGPKGEDGRDGDDGRDGKDADISNVVTFDFLDRQISRVYDSLTDRIRDLKENLSKEITTDILTVNDDARFLGDLYANNLILTGSVTSGDTTFSNLSVIGNTVLGDATSDTITVNGSITFLGSVNGITKDTVGLSNVPNLVFSGSNTGDETNSSIKIKLGITTLSGDNTGDETTSSIKTKLGQASGTNDGYLSSTDWGNFNNKVSSQWVTSGSNIYYNTGNVGIGTSNPSIGLSVVGNVQVLNAPNGFYTSYGPNGIYSGTNNFTFTTYDGSSIQNRLFINASSGNVGIGTITPTSKLHILGGLKIDSSNPLVDLVDSNGADWKISLQDNHLSFLGNDGVTEYVRFNNGGNVGIGTSSPSDKLSVQGGISAISTNYKSTLSASDSGNGSLYTSSPLFNFNYWNGTAVVTAFNYNNSGNVGIGTASPTGKLDVSGINTSYPSSVVTAGDLVVDTNNSIVYIGKQSNTGGDNTNFIFRDRLGNVKSRWENAGSGSISFGNFSTNYGVSIANSALTGGATTTARLVVDSGSTSFPSAVFTNGNVGIGTTNPTYPLEVVGAIRLSNPAQLIISDTSYVKTEGAFIDSDTTRAIRFGIVDNSVVPVGINIYETNNDYTSTYINFRTGNADVLRINNLGNVGIGTTNPTYNLDVTGSIRVTSDIKSTTYSNTNLTFGVNSNGLLTASGIRNYADSIINGLTRSSTSGIYSSFSDNISIIPTSGTAIFNGFNYSDTINQTGGANGITRAIYINPTLTSAYDFRAIELTNNLGMGIYQTGTAINSFAGNVGIGTTGPLAKFSVNANGSTFSPVSVGGNSTFAANISDNLNGISGVQMGNTNTGTDADFRFLIKDTTDHYIAFMQPGVNNNSSGGTILGHARATGDFIINSGGTLRDMVIGTGGAKDLIFGTNNAENMRILSGGSVGIGTTTPTTAQLVAVSGNTTELNTSSNGSYGVRSSGPIKGNDFYLYNNYGGFRTAGGGHMFYADSAGRFATGSNTGLSGLYNIIQNTTGNGTVSTNGTTLTGSNTSFLSTFKVGDTVTVSGETVRTISTITSDTVLSVSVAFSNTASGLSYTLVGGNRLTVMGNGNVGIGTTNPGATFDVNGIVNALTSYRVGNATIVDFSATTARFAPSSSFNAVTIGSVTTLNSSFPYGNVGIGTTTPVSKLNIASSPVASANSGTISLGGGIFDGVTAGKFSGSSSGTSLAINEASGYTGKLADFQVNGVSRWSISANAAIQTNDINGFYIANAVRATDFQIGSGGPRLMSGGDGIIILQNNAINGFYRLNFGAATSSFPSLKVVGSDLQVIRADGTTNSNLLVTGNLGVGITTPAQMIELNNGSIGLARFSSTVAKTVNIGIGNGSGLLSNSGWWGGLQISQTATDATTFGISTTPNNASSASTRFFIDGSGNVGIGTTNPLEKLHISAGNLMIDNNQTIIFRRPSWGNIAGIYANYNTNQEGYLAFQTNNGSVLAEKMRIDKDGNVGIGITNPSKTLDVVGTFQVSGVSNFNSYNTFGSVGYMGQSSQIFTGGSASDLGIRYSSNLQFGTSLTNITTTMLSSGNVGIGTTSPSYKLQVGNNTVSGIVARFENSTGICDINPTTTSLVCSSDINLKKNITKLDNTEFILQELGDLNDKSILERINYLTPVTYNWNREDDNTTKHIGLIAQEVEQIFPDLVFTDSNTNNKSIAYTNLIPYTISAINELDLKVKNLSSLDVEIENSFGFMIKSFLGDIGNQINDLYVNIVHTDKIETKMLCVGDTCVTEEQFLEIVNKNVTAPSAEIIEEDIEENIDTPVNTEEIIEDDGIVESPVDQAILEPVIQEETASDNANIDQP